jgi:Flp pilus assembly pilin Flp
MPELIHRLAVEDDGVLSFEWTLLTTLLVIGIVGGLSAARDAIIDELGDTAQVMMAVDQSYHIGFPLLVTVHDPAVSSASDTTFSDALIYSDCARAALFIEDQSQIIVLDIDS